MIAESTDAVRHFMIQQIGRQPRTKPGWPEDRIILQRLAYLNEELGEMSTAINTKNLVELADGLADLLVIVQGLALDAGIPLDEVLAEVCKSNATKQPLDPVSGKGGKGDRFCAPKILEILMAHGWPGPELPI